MADPDNKSQTAQISPDTGPASNMNSSPNLPDGEQKTRTAAPTNQNTSTLLTNDGGTQYSNRQQSTA